MKESARHVMEVILIIYTSIHTQGLHPRIVTEGYLLGKEKALEVLETMKKPVTSEDRELLLSVARSVIGTKVVL